MATEDNEQSPFTRPGFVAAAGVVALIVVLGIVIGVVNATGDGPQTDATPPSDRPPATASTSEPSSVSGDASVCGLSGVELTGSLSTDPETEWEFQGTTGYPTSASFGPASALAAGGRYCFQHSPTGALFAAANMLVQGSDPTVSAEWLEYALADGPFRENLLTQKPAEYDGEGSRLRIAGFRVLHYDGQTARIDLAVRATAAGENLSISSVYELIWQAGDWKMSTATGVPVDTAPVPDFTGYVAWGE